MPATVVVGSQWGDEGKGKIIDVLAREAAWTVRFQGGANAGHTIQTAEERFALHLLPSGAVRPGIRCGLGWGMVIDPDRLLDEIAELEARGIEIRSRLTVSGRASLLLPHHVARDGAEEASRSGSGIGTTRRGIGPAYAERAARSALLLADLLEPDGEASLRSAQDRLNEPGGLTGHRAVEWKDLRKSWERWKKEVSPLIGNLPARLDESLRSGELVLLEGAQGTHLDLLAGTYPFVTSSSTLAGGACTGCGIGPGRIDRVVGVVKAYTTRVGAGPFPTEQTGADGEWLRKRGAERGTTTGRPRRCGWLDLPLLRAAVLWNGITEIALTKADVLTGRKAIPVAVAYELEGRTIELPPDSPHAVSRVRPVYEEWGGWHEMPESMGRESDLPAGLRAYAKRIARAAGVPVTILSTGPERDATLLCSIGA